MTHCFFLVTLYSLQLGEPGPLLVGTYVSPLNLRTVSLLCSCKFLGGGGAFISLLEVISFHPFPSPAVFLTLIAEVDTACFFIADGDWGFSSCCVSGKTLSITLSFSLMMHSLLTSSHISSTCQQSSSKTGHLLQSRGPSLLASERGSRHFLQSRTWRAASAIWSSLCVEDFALAGTAAPTCIGETALLPPCLRLTAAQFQLRPPYFTPPSHPAAQTAGSVGCALGLTQVPPEHKFKGAWLS